MQQFNRHSLRLCLSAPDLSATVASVSSAVGRNSLTHCGGRGVGGHKSLGRFVDVSVHNKTRKSRTR